MTPEAINIAIDEACGVSSTGWYCPQCREMVHPANVTFEERHDKEGCFAEVHADGLPNYHGSLDAMHEAEMTLDGFASDLYANHLVDLLNPSRIDGYDPDEDGAPTLSWPGLFVVLKATAAQRAEAFLRTKGLWT